jgi:hypothetical protein
VVPGTEIQVRFDEANDPATCPVGPGVVFEAHHLIEGGVGVHRFEQTRTITLYADGASPSRAFGAQPLAAEQGAVLSTELAELIADHDTADCTQSFGAYPRPYPRPWSDILAEGSLSVSIRCDEKAGAWTALGWCDDPAACRFVYTDID